MDGEDVGLLEVADTAEVEETSSPGDVSGVSGGEETGSDERPDLHGDGEQDQEQLDKLGDKRTLPVQIRNAIRKFTQANPDFAKENPRFEKEVVGALFTQKALSELGGIQAVRSLKEAIEMHGGIEGVQELATEVEAARALDSGLEKGDPQVIEGYIRDFPEGFKRIVPTALDALAKNFPEDYQRLGSTIIHNTFRNNNLYDAVGRIGEALKAGDAKSAVADYDKLVDLLLEVQKSATQSQHDPLADQRKQIDTERQSIAAERKTAFIDKVRGEVDPMVVRDVNKIVGTALKGRVMEVPVRNRLLNEIRGALANKVHSEPNYSRQWPGVRDAGDHGRAVKFNYAAYSKALPAIVNGIMKDPVWRSYFNGAAKPVLQARTERPANATVAGRPQIADVDFSRTDKATFIGSRQHGTAWLRSGKQAKW